MEGHDDSTWGTDEALIITTHFVEEFDNDIYLAIAIVTGTVISIPLIGKALISYGMYFTECDISSKCLPSDKHVSRVIRRVIRWNSGPGFEARLISFLGKLIRYENIGAIFCCRPHQSWHWSCIQPSW